MSLGFIHNQVNKSLARGDAFNDEIPAYVRMAARWIEQNYNLQHMERYGEFYVSTSASFPKYIELPSQRVKAVRFLQTVYDGQVTNIRRAMAEDLSRQDVPSRVWGFWQAGDGQIVLAGAPDDGQKFSMAWWEYTAWPTNLEAENWLILNAEALLVSQALIFMAARVRDNSILQAYQVQKQEALKILLNAQEDAKYEGMKARMSYVPQGI